MPRVRCAHPFFLAGTAGGLFAIYFPEGAEVERRRAVLHCPAFAEEMNKSRKMVAWQARAFAERGVAAMILDLYGTGDSQGDFGEARWDIWISDLKAGIDWLRGRGYMQIWLWGLRGGCLLASDVASLPSADITKLIFWQPVLRGDVWLSQFLRLRMVATMMGKDERETERSLRATLAEGTPLEVAGYFMNPQLAQSLSRTSLVELAETLPKAIDWLEVSPMAAGRLAPASGNVVERLEQGRKHVRVSAVSGDAFWATQEITVVPELIKRTQHLAEG